MCSKSRDKVCNNQLSFKNESDAAKNSGEPENKDDI